jgi:hypothetical protein
MVLAWSAAMDFVLAALPWHVLMGLNIKQKDKHTIAGSLSLGVFAGVCSIVRTVELRSLSSMENYVYDTAPMLLWSSSEVCLTIVCASIPALRPLYVRIVYGSHGESSGRRSYPLEKYSSIREGVDAERRDSLGSRKHMGHRQSVVAGGSVYDEILSPDPYHQVPPMPLEVDLERAHDIHVTTTITVKEEHLQ